MAMLPEAVAPQVFHLAAELAGVPLLELRRQLVHCCTLMER